MYKNVLCVMAYALIFLLFLDVSKPLDFSKYINTENNRIISEKKLNEEINIRVADVYGINLNKLISKAKTEDHELYDVIVQFFIDETNNEKISKLIISKSIEFDVPVSLAFALSYQESKYDEKCISKNSKSTDYGLFQLNNLTFSKYTEKEMLNYNINIHEGLKFLSYLRKKFDSDYLSLAAYNAGPSRITNKEIPWTTFLHVSKINDKICDIEEQLLDFLSYRIAKL